VTGHVAEFVDDQQLARGELALQPQQTLLVTGFNQFVDEGGGGAEADRKAPLAGGQTQAQRDGGFAGAGIAEGDHVLAALQIIRIEPAQARAAC
jgi:hypothetical protein